MANISKCAVCGKDVPGQREILRDSNNQPYRLCSDNCFNDSMEREAAMDSVCQEWDSRCAEAVRKGEAETGIKSADASDGLIMSWIDKYAHADENSVVES